MNMTTEQRDKLQPFKKEAFNLMSEIVAAKENLKDNAEAAAAATGLEKAFITKHFSVLFNEKLEGMEEEVEMHKFLAGQE